MENENIDNSIIKNYINGEDLGEYNVENLENDKNFMKNVIDYTDDYKIYNLCSDNLKKDYNFVKYLVYKFKDNFEFIKKVSDYYLNNTNNELNRKELCIIMENILPDKLAKDYKVINNAQYLKDRIEFEMINCKKSSLEPLVGMGFSLIKEKYNDNNIILDYYVKNLINEITDEDNKLKIFLYEKFETENKMSKEDITNNILEFILGYDKILSLYICTHLNLIDNVITKAEKLQDKWYNEIEKINENRIYEMFDMIHEYIHISDSYLFETSTIYYIAKELGIENKIEEYYTNKIKTPDNEMYDNIIEDEIIIGTTKEDIDYDFVESCINSSPENKRDYSNIKKIMKNQLFTYNKLDVSSLINFDNKNKEKKLFKNNQFPPEGNND